MNNSCLTPDSALIGKLSPEFPLLSTDGVRRNYVGSSKRNFGAMIIALTLPTLNTQLSSLTRFTSNFILATRDGPYMSPEFPMIIDLTLPIQSLRIG